MNNIKVLNTINTNTSKLYNVINLLKKEKEVLGLINDELQKKINSLDKNNFKNKLTNKTTSNSSNNSSSIFKYKK